MADLAVTGVQLLVTVIRNFKRAHDQVKHNKTILELLKEHVDLVEDSLQEIEQRGLDVSQTAVLPFRKVLEECVGLVEEHMKVDRKKLFERAKAYLKHHLKAGKVMENVQELNQKLTIHSQHLQQILQIQTLAQLQELPGVLTKEAIDKDERQNHLYIGQEIAQTKGIVDPSILELVEDKIEGTPWNLDETEIVWEMEDDRRVVIGKGGMGKVYKATWKGQMVAVKEFPVGEDLVQPDSYSEFLSEVELYSKLRHKNVVALHGVKMTGQPYLMVMELAGGNLKQLVEGQPEAPKSWVAKVQLLLDASQGLNQLHSLHIPHRNLKASDLLIFPDPDAISGYTVKVSDFGLVTTRTKTRALTQTGGECQSSLAPPEFTNGYTYGLKSDIFLFGVVMYEFVGRQPPRLRFGNGRFRPEGSRAALERHFKLRKDCPEALKEVMAKCCSTQPHNRPWMPEIVDRLAEELERQKEAALDE